MVLKNMKKKKKKEPDLREPQNPVWEPVTIESEGGRVQIVHRVKEVRLIGEFLEATENTANTMESRLKYFRH